jgi:5,10-methylenetetrahydromethanopterin reductase
LAGAAMAKSYEDLGFDICYFGDNSCFAPDTFGELRDAARATTRIKIATGVTNTVTKHPSWVATSIAPIQILSGGRAVCGLGKGDSSMGTIGRGPQKHAEFVEKAEMLRHYLRREPIPINGWQSRLEWLDNFPDYTPVPLEIMASGPKSIKAAAMIADRVTLAISADPERIAWANAIIDEGLAEAGRSRDEIEVGGFFMFAVDDDRAAAAQRLRVRTKGIAHMASFAGHDLSYQPEILRSATEAMRTAYDYKHHDNQVDNPLADLVSAEFAAWFGIGGPTSYIVDRIGQLAEAGLSYVFTADLPDPEWEAFTQVVMPKAR